MLEASTQNDEQQDTPTTSKPPGEDASQDNSERQDTPTTSKLPGKDASQDNSERQDTPTTSKPPGEDASQDNSEQQDLSTKPPVDDASQDNSDQQDWLTKPPVEDVNNDTSTDTKPIETQVNTNTDLDLDHDFELLSPDDIALQESRLKACSDSLQNTKVRHAKWLEGQTRRRMLALARLHKLIKIHKERLRFYDDITGKISQTSHEPLPVNVNTT